MNCNNKNCLSNNPNYKYNCEAMVDLDVITADCEDFVAEEQNLKDSEEKKAS